MPSPPTATWKARLAGNRHDLEFLARNFAVDQIRVTNAPNNDGYFLESDNFDPAASAEVVLSQCRDLLPILSGILRFEKQIGAELSSDGVILCHPDGHEKAFLFFHETISVHASMTAEVVSADGSAQSLTPQLVPSQADLLLTLAASDPAVAKALRLLGTSERTWVDLYRIYEVVEGDVGGQHHLQVRGWAAKDEIRGFKHSANSVAVGGDEARHGIEQQQPPSNPLTLEQAHVLVHRLVTSWLVNKRRAP